MRVLVLGGYGLIGLEIVRRLRGDGFDVVGLGRSAERGRSAAPDVPWIAADLARLTKPEDWLPHIRAVDAVVNAAGALQDSARDRLSALQHRSVQALVAACEQAGGRRFIQISAPGADTDASTAFLRTKAHGDASLRASKLQYTIFKPGLVISTNAYGGTSLLRMLAATPWVQPVVLGDRLIQTVPAADVAEAVARALSTPALSGHEFDLVEEHPHALREVVLKFRAWLGFPRPAFVLQAPPACGFALARVADLLGWLGWRSPLRTTALRAISANVVGDPAAWTQASGRTIAALDATLASLPSTAQERIYARAQLLFPVLLGVSSAFWTVSGAVALTDADRAAAVLAATPLAEGAHALVTAGAVADIGIGIAFLVRPLTIWTAWAAIGASALYLVLATVFTPWLWSDPLGPLVKVFPAIALALAVIGLMQER